MQCLFQTTLLVDSTDRICSNVSIEWFIEPDHILNPANGRKVLRHKTLKSTQIEWNLHTALPTFNAADLIEQAHIGIAHDIKKLFLEIKPIHIAFYTTSALLLILLIVCPCFALKCCPGLLPDCFQHLCGMRIAERALQIKNKEKAVIYKEIHRIQDEALENVNKEAKAFLDVQNPTPSAPSL